MKAIAVSRDLIAEGLDHGRRVRIEGLRGGYIVRDERNKRRRKKIDIFMGHELQRARPLGKRTASIH